MSEQTGSVRQYQTRLGPMIGLASDIYISRSLELYGEYCLGEHQALAQMIKPGMTVLEAGANIGSHTVGMARACAPGRLYAFEPQQRIFQILCANLALNDIGNVNAYPEGLGEDEGWAVVPRVNYGAQGNFGGLAMRPDGAPGERTRVVTVDSLGLAELHLLKVDVEGFEPKVLRGARRTIARCRPLLYVENDRKDQQQEVISLIADMGYRMYWHAPPLFRADNFNGVQDNVFGTVGSMNLLCIPNESAATVAGNTPIDPQNWRPPFEPSR